jgi:hypothetical protein
MSTTSTTGVTRINRTEARNLASAEFEKFAGQLTSPSRILKVFFERWFHDVSDI